MHGTVSRLRGAPLSSPGNQGIRIGRTKATGQSRPNPSDSTDPPELIPFYSRGLLPDSVQSEERRSRKPMATTLESKHHGHELCSTTDQDTGTFHVSSMRVRIKPQNLPERPKGLSSPRSAQLTILPYKPPNDKELSRRREYDKTTQVEQIVLL